MILVFEQLNSILYLMVAMVVTLTFFTELKWPNSAYYIALITLPIYTNLWIYFTYKLKLQGDEEVLNIRRLLAYLLLVIYVLKDSYLKFYCFFDNKQHYKMDNTSYLLYIASIVFIALDRFLKAWTDDYRKFKNTNSGLKSE